VQASWSLIMAIGYPARFIRVLTDKSPFGQAITQSPQPLQRSFLNLIFDMAQKIL
jgi:hypothetical protein